MTQNPPAGNGYQRPFEALLDVTREQTVLMTRLVELQAQANRQLEVHGGLLSEARTSMSGAPAARAQQTSELKTHITMTLQTSERWWRKAIIVLGLIVILAQVFQAPVERLLGFVK